MTSGFLAEPAAGSGPGVLVLHAWWGLNDTIRAACTRLADAGFVAYAPDLYHGAVATTIPEAEALGKTLDANVTEARAEVAQAMADLAGRAGSATQGLAVVGFSLGAYYALDLAATSAADIRSVVVFYGSGVDDHGVSKAAYLGHFAQDDPYEPAASVDHLEASLRRAGRLATIHRYPGVGHWFAEPDRTDAFDAQAAGLAWQRTLDFLRGASQALTGATPNRRR
jgi:carboxymethylenebutenolidase